MPLLAAIGNALTGQSYQRKRTFEKFPIEMRRKKNQNSNEKNMYLSDI
jgi:hypothetical protein